MVTRKILKIRSRPVGEERASIKLEQKCAGQQHKKINNRQQALTK